MTRFFTALLVALLGLGLATDARAQGPTPTAEEIFARSLKVIKTVDSYQGQFVMRELIGDKLVISKVHFKFKRPFKVYMKYITKPEGQEVLFVRGENDNEIKAHKGSFPDITVNLNPYGDWDHDGRSNQYEVHVGSNPCVAHTYHYTHTYTHTQSTPQ